LADPRLATARPGRCRLGGLRFFGHGTRHRRSRRSDRRGFGPWAVGARCVAANTLRSRGIAPATFAARRIRLGIGAAVGRGPGPPCASTIRPVLRPTRFGGRVAAKTPLIAPALIRTPLTRLPLIRTPAAAAPFAAHAICGGKARRPATPLGRAGAAVAILALITPAGTGARGTTGPFGTAGSSPAGRSRFFWRCQGESSFCRPLALPIWMQSQQQVEYCRPGAWSMVRILAIRQPDTGTGV
jgi:hypothetical protein